MHAWVHTHLFTCMHIVHAGAHTYTHRMFAFPPSPQHWLTCSFIQPSTNPDTMVTAAEMCFPWESDNIEITTPLTTQPSSHPSLSYHTSSIALFPCSVWHSLPCKGKLLELAALLTAWQVCVLCQLQPPTLVFLLEKPSRHGREPCGSRTGGSGNLMAQNQHQSTVVAEYCTCHWT